MPRHSTLKFVPHFPSEVWLRIFRFATISSACHQFYETEYVPFHDPPGEDDRALLEETRRTKRSLVLVCKHWRELAIEFLYEDIQIKSGSPGLREGLEGLAQAKAQDGCRRWVRYVELSLLKINNVDNAVTPVDILQWYPNLDTLAIDDDRVAHPPTETFSVTLKRFDWWYSRHPDGIHDFQRYFSHGFGFLLELVKRAPNLQYLSIGGRESPTFPNISNPPPLITLHSLTTLRLERLDWQLYSEKQNWDFPNLTHLVIDRSLDFPSDFLSRHKVRVLELLPGGRSFDRLYLGSLVRICVALQELNYYIEYVYPLPSDYPAQNFSLRCIRLHSKPSMMLGSLHDVWDHVRGHFLMFVGPMFPALERIVLYGDWSHIVNDPRFRPVQDYLLARGCSLEYWDGAPVSVATAKLSDFGKACLWFDFALCVTDSTEKTVLEHALT